jgi:Uma2 family endonuclease
MPATKPHVEPLTVEDYRATPEGTRYQLIEGELHLMSPGPNLFHQDIAGNIYQLLRNHATKHRLGRVFIAPADVYLSAHNVVQPDVFFVSAANVSILAEDGAHGPPDLVVEVLSPHTTAHDTRKLRVYARHGVKEQWLVDPSKRQIHLYDFARQPTKAVRVVNEADTLSSTLLPGLALRASEIFQR